MMSHVCVRQIVVVLIYGLKYVFVEIESVLSFCAWMLFKVCNCWNMKYWSCLSLYVVFLNKYFTIHCSILRLCMNSGCIALLYMWKYNKDLICVARASVKYVIFLNLPKLTKYESMVFGHSLILWLNHTSGNRSVLYHYCNVWFK